MHQSKSGIQIGRYPHQVRLVCIYLNDNDGYTEFETGEKVMSQTNTAVIFDTNLRHRCSCY